MVTEANIICINFYRKVFIMTHSITDSVFELRYYEKGTNTFGTLKYKSLLFNTESQMLYCLLDCLTPFLKNSGKLKLSTQSNKEQEETFFYFVDVYEDCVFTVHKHLVSSEKKVAAEPNERSSLYSLKNHKLGNTTYYNTIAEALTHNEYFGFLYVQKDNLTSYADNEVTICLVEDMGEYPVFNVHINNISTGNTESYTILKTKTLNNSHDLFALVSKQEVTING